jgi:Ca2+-binding EF-hand superfamily protein
MPPRAFAGPLGVNQGEGIPPPRDLITSDTPPGTPRDDDDDDLTVASVCNIGMRGNKKAMAGAVQRFDESMTPEQGLLNLRRKIALQLKGGSHGLMRCWVLFRNRSGSTKQGITFAEFKRGLKSYAIDAPERVAREMFDRMDASGDDHIQIKEFIDHVMGRWDPSANVLGGHKSAAEIARIGRGAKKVLVKDAVDDTLTVERGLVMLRQKIGQRLASGPGGLLRCWVNFRQRAGASKEGITASEWERGLKMYGVPLNKARARELFDRMDASGDGYIQIKEFIDQVRSCVLCFSCVAAIA